MKKIITALADKNLNEKLKEKKEYEIIIPDIQYQDGVIEALEKYKEIDILILKDSLDGEKTIYEFIEEIKKIKFNLQIIVILNKKNEEIKKFLISKGINKIFYNNINTEEIIKNLTTNKKIISEEYDKKIEKRKENKLKNNINKIKNIINKIISEKNIKHKINNKNKIISVCGINGIGKSVFCVIISKIIKNKKILLIDLNIFNNSISTIFGVKKYNKIIKINKDIDAVCVPEMFIKREKIEKEKFNSFIDENIDKYDLIFIDTSSVCEKEYIKTISEKSDIILFLTEANILQLNKTHLILKRYIYEYNINIKKIKIIFNKYNIFSIEKNILKNIFWEFNILGKIKLNKKYNLIINKNTKIINHDIKKEYTKIINKILN